MSRQSLMRSSRCLSASFAVMLLIVSVAQASDKGGLAVETTKLNADVLYIDLAKPADARGISLYNEMQVTNLVVKEIAGQPAVQPKNEGIVIKIDPALVKDQAPILLALNYYEPNGQSWKDGLTFEIRGFQANPGDYKYNPYTAKVSIKGTGADEWRWKALLRYANYGDRQWMAGPDFKAGQQATLSFIPGKFSLGRVLILPLNEARIKEIHAVQKQLFAMLAEYNRLCVADARGENARMRLEQALNYYKDSKDTAASLAELFRRADGDIKQANAEMDAALEDVDTLDNSVYLGFFDGRKDERLEALNAFKNRVAGLTRARNQLAEEMENAVSRFAETQMKKQNLDCIAFSAVKEKKSGELIDKQDINDRFFFGRTGGIGYLNLDSPELFSSLHDDGKLDFVYDYSFTDLVMPNEDGTYDFSRLDALLAAPRNKGMRVIIGLHNIDFPEWACRKFWSEQMKAPEGQERYFCKTVEGPGKPHGVANINDLFSSGMRPATNKGLAWSDALIKYSADLHRAFGKHFRDNPVVLKYNVNSEGGTEQVLKTGYGYDGARPIFQKYLEEKFHTIEALNKAFGTTYGDFKEITLPKPGPDEKMVRLTPAYYEYFRLAIERLQLARKTAVKALHEGDPNRAVGEVHSGVFGTHQLDTYALSVAMPYDTFLAGDSWPRTVRYTYSYNRYRPRPIWSYEPYIMNKMYKYDMKTSYHREVAGRHMLTGEIWTWFLWGHQGLPFFAWTERNIAIYDLRIDDLSGCQPALRPLSGCLSYLKPLFNNLQGIVKNAPVVPARIGLLESATTLAVPYPERGPYGDILAIQTLLENRHKHFFFVPETAIVEGAETLSEYRIIVAAYSTHLRPEARERLLAWVRQGGVLIASGPTGLYDHYGRSEGNIPREVFGLDKIEYSPATGEKGRLTQCAGTMAGQELALVWSAKDFYWRFASSGGLKPGTTVLASLSDGTPVVVERSYGKGRVVMTASPIGLTSDIYLPLLLAEINRAEPIPAAQSASDELRLVLRADKQGIRYLGIINMNESDPEEAVVTVAGEFKSPQDLTIGGGLPIPAVVGGGVTRIPVRLGPGQAGFICLGKPEKDISVMSADAESAYLQLEQFSGALQKAETMGIDTQSYKKTLSAAQKNYAEGKYHEALAELAGASKAILAITTNTRMEAVKQQARQTANPLAGSWAVSYAEMGRAFLEEGKASMAEEYLSMAESALKQNPAPRKAEVIFPFVTKAPNLKDLSGRPKGDWQVIYKDKERKEEAGRFLLMGSSNGIYLAAQVKEAIVTDRSQIKQGVQWRAMDGVVLNLRCLDKTEKLSAAFRSDDTYEITFYADGSVFMWENPLKNRADLIKNEVTLTNGGYQVAGFIPAETIRFWPRAGVSVIADIGICSYDDAPKTKSETFFWHGTYAQADTWGRVQLGEAAGQAKPAQPDVPENVAVYSGKNVAELCMEPGHWVPHENRGVGNATDGFEAFEKLPNGKGGAIVLMRPDAEEKAQLKTQFNEMGKRRGLRVWLKGENTGGDIELRVSGREGYTRAMHVKDDFRDWRAVEVALDSCEKTREDYHTELLNGDDFFRPNLNMLIVRLTRPAGSVKVGLVEYLE